MYTLTDKPKNSRTLMAGAFDAIDQVYGTEEFSKEQGIEAIYTIASGDEREAESLFRDLMNSGHITGA